jgi:hypothetical protein
MYVDLARAICVCQTFRKIGDQSMPAAFDAWWAKRAPAKPRYASVGYMLIKSVRVTLHGTDVCRVLLINDDEHPIAFLLRKQSFMPESFGPMPAEPDVTNRLTATRESSRRSGVVQVLGHATRSAGHDTQPTHSVRYYLTAAERGESRTYDSRPTAHRVKAPNNLSRCPRRRK